MDGLTQRPFPLGFFFFRPDRYVPLFGMSSYDLKLERPDSVPFEEQLRALEEVIKAGKVRQMQVTVND